MNTESLTLLWQLLPLELWNTFYMVLISTFFAICFGVPLGVILTVTDKGHLIENKRIYSFLGTLVNTGRSFPFVILSVALIPFTRWIVGTSLGTTAAIVPLTIAAIPFTARLVETSLKEIDKSLVETALVMGSSPWQIITKVLLAEAFPSLILAMTTVMINLIGYSAMAGTLGGGGLGKVAIQYGYQRFDSLIMFSTVLVLILFVQIIQWLGNYFAYKVLQKRGKGVSL